MSRPSKACRFESDHWYHLIKGINIFMKFNQHVILKHKHGITAQWMSDDWTQMSIATYQQIEIKATKSNPDPDASNEEVIIKKWALANCSGPWTGLSEDGKELTVIPGHEEARNKIAGEASLLLTLFGAYIGGKKPFENLWTGATIGFEDFWPEDSVG